MPPNCYEGVMPRDDVRTCKTEDLRRLSAVGMVAAAACLFILNPVFAKLAFANGLDPVRSLVRRFGLPCVLLAPFWLRPRTSTPMASLRRHERVGDGFGLPRDGWADSMGTDAPSGGMTMEAETEMS